MKYFLFNSFGILMLLLMGCQTPKAAVEETGQEVDRKAQIGFFVYRAYKDGEAVPKIKMVEQLAVDGTVKTRKKESAIADAADLMFVQVSKDQKILESEHIEDPLHKVIEYQLDSGELTKKMIALDSADFTVRVNLHALATAVEIRMASDSTTILHAIKL
jgi:hypothetical protein